MGVLAEILGLVMQLAFFGVIAWVIVRFLGHRRNAGEEAEVDRATSVRRFFVYGLMLVTLILGAVGATMVGLTLLTSSWSNDERTALALGLAFMLVAGPAYAFLLRFTRGRLRDDVSERASLAWAAYLNIALASSLIVSTVTVHNFLAGVFGVDDFEWRGIAPVTVWAAVWAMHWFWLRPAHGLPGDLHLAVGSLTGLVTMMIGLGGVAYVAGDGIYASVVERLPAGHESPELATWLIATGVGAVVWAWHWLGCYLRAERTSLWHVYVLLIGTLGGLAASISSGATIAYWTAVWHLGNPKMDLPSEHFEHVPVAAAFLVAGMATWQYHRTVLRAEGPVDRSEPLRAHDYLMAASRSRRDRRRCHARPRCAVRVDRRPDHRGPVRRCEPPDPGRHPRCDRPAVVVDVLVADPRAPRCRPDRRARLAEPPAASRRPVRCRRPHCADRPDRRAVRRNRRSARRHVRWREHSTPPGSG